MSDRLSNALRLHSHSLDFATGRNKFGTVSSVNPNTSMARILLQPEGVLTGWLPVLSPWVGSSWGLICLPQVGDQVLVSPQEGDMEQGIVIGSCFSKSMRPPAAPLGEFWLVHKSGSSLKLSNDGVIHITGDLHVLGDIFDRQGSLSHLRNAYNTHSHATPNGTSSGPTPEDNGNG